jgi:hypothetical protein
MIQPMHQSSNQPFIPESIRQVLPDIYLCLQSTPLEALDMKAGPIRDWFLEISSQLPKDLKRLVQPMAFFEYHQDKVEEVLERAQTKCCPHYSRIVHHSSHRSGGGIASKDA